MWFLAAIDTSGAAVQIVITCSVQHSLVQFKSVRLVLFCLACSLAIALGLLSTSNDVCTHGVVWKGGYRHLPDLDRWPLLANSVV